MFISNYSLTRKALALFSAALLGGGLLYLPAQALEIDSHAGHNHLVTNNVMVMLEFHNMAEHKQEMTNKNAPMGFSGNNMIAVQLLDSESKQALPGVQVKATITGPDKKLVGKEGMELQWFAPAGRAPYYGAGLDLSAPGKYRVVISFKKGDKASHVAFAVKLK